MNEENSRTISQMTLEQIKKEEEYETIILRQREKIKLLEKEVFSRQKCSEGK